MKKQIYLYSKTKWNIHCRKSSGFVLLCLVH